MTFWTELMIHLQYFWMLGLGILVHFAVMHANIPHKNQAEIVAPCAPSNSVWSGVMSCWLELRSKLQLDWRVLNYFLLNACPYPSSAQLPASTPKYGLISPIELLPEFVEMLNIWELWVWSLRRAFAYWNWFPKAWDHWGHFLRNQTPCVKFQLQRCLGLSFSKHGRQRQCN